MEWRVSLQSSAGAFIERGRRRGYKEELLKSTFARELVKERKKSRAKKAFATIGQGLWTNQSVNLFEKLCICCLLKIY